MREMITLKECFDTYFYKDDGTLFQDDDSIVLFRWWAYANVTVQNRLIALYPTFFTAWQKFCSANFGIYYLDFMYTQRSGDKWVSKLLYNRAKSNIKFLPISEPDDKKRRLTNLVYTILDKFASKWERLLDTLYLDYNPIHNYDMEEDEKVNTYLETSDDIDKYTNGFNSSTASPTDKSENTIIVDGDWDNNKRNLTRKGNIGVTTSQQMMESEIELRQYNFIEQMFEDIDSLLTLSVY